MIRNCNFCKKEYVAESKYLNRGQGLYCTRSCAGKYKASLLEPLIPNTQCLYCNTPLYRKPSHLKEISFCSHEHQSFAACDNSLKYKPGPKPKLFNCDICQRKITAKNKLGRCMKCRKEIAVAQWLEGDLTISIGNGITKDPKPFIKEYLLITKGDKCEVCGFNEKASDGKSIIQMDHIDGNFLNNALNNLQLLCPNHHAMTDAYGSKNKHGGRAHRRKQRSTD